MNKYNRNNTIIVIGVAILLLVVSALIYNLYFKNYVDNNKEEEKKESLYVDITDENIINELLHTINANNLKGVASFEKDIDNINALQPLEKIDIAYNAIKKEDQSVIEVEELDNYFKDSFKTTIYYDKSDIFCSNGEALYQFDLATNSYVYNSLHNCENHNEVIPSYTKVLSAKKKNNIYVITVSYVWNNTLAPDTMYETHGNALNQKDMLLAVPSEEGNPSEEDITNFIDSSYDNIKDKLHKYTYVFDKQDNKYLLESFKYE